MGRYAPGCAVLLLWYAFPNVASARAPVDDAATTLAITMMNECGISETVVRTAELESTRIWAAAEVSVRWMSPDEIPFGAPRSDWLVVRCVAGEVLSGPKAPRTAPIANIRFLGSQPLNTIIVNAGNANTLLSREAHDLATTDAMPLAYKELRLGRMLGRAIAHEIGHFLSQSTAHTRSGLMRATHTVPALVGDSLYPFRIDRVVFTALVADARCRAGDERCKASGTAALGWNRQ